MSPSHLSKLASSISCNCPPAGGQLQEMDDANLLRCEGDIPSIGILLCKNKDSSVVEWSLRGITTPLGVYGKNGY